MVFDQISTSGFSSASDVAVVPVPGGYLAAAFRLDTLSWGTWSTATDTWVQGQDVVVDTGNGANPDYGAVFVDGVEQTANGLDYQDLTNNPLTLSSSTKNTSNQMKYKTGIPTVYTANPQIENLTPKFV